MELSKEVGVVHGRLALVECTVQLNMNSQDTRICDCGTPFRPGARMCANSACG